MAAFRLFSKLNTFHGLTGQLLTGGQLRFFEAGTTTPADVYGDPDLLVNNGVTVALDSSGRPNVDIWGEGEYFVEVYDSLGVKQGDADDVGIPGDAAASIPALETGKFLTNNGAILLWSTIREVPDPTGQANKILGTDGTNLLWVVRPADGSTPTVPPLPVDGIVQTSDSVTIGKIMFQFGTGTAPASGGRTTSVGVTFPTPMTTTLYVGVTVTTSPITGVGYNAVDANANETGTGFTFKCDVNADQSGADINVGVSFKYMAVGLIP